MQVSVIIPAYNAEETIADTLQSLVDQTFPDWEAIVVDDGSTDATAAICSRFAERDSRIRVLSQENRGESGARNSGVAVARFEWLLFLDSDDWILPEYFGRFGAVLTSDPGLDIAYCGWTYVTPDGKYVFPSLENAAGDLFNLHAQYCFSIVHTYLVRRALVQEAEGFDVKLRTCADWDMWQRIARTGARFGVVPEILAIYRMRAGSASRDGYRLLADGLRVIERGHGRDPRVRRASPLHLNGRSPETLAERKFELACACAGYLIGAGNDARPLLKLLEGERWPALDAYTVATCLFRHTMVSAARPLSEWGRVWPEFAGALRDFLVSLESASGTRGLAPKAQPVLEHLATAYKWEGGLIGLGQRMRSRLFLELHRPPRRIHRLRCWARRLASTSLQKIFHRPAVNS